MFIIDVGGAIYARLVVDSPSQKISQHNMAECGKQQRTTSSNGKVSHPRFPEAIHRLRVPSDTNSPAAATGNSHRCQEPFSTNTMKENLSS